MAEEGILPPPPATTQQGVRVDDAVHDQHRVVNEAGTVAQQLQPLLQEPASVRAPVHVCTQPQPTNEGRTRARRNSLHHGEKALHGFQASIQPKPEPESDGPDRCAARVGSDELATPEPEGRAKVQVMVGASRGRGSSSLERIVSGDQAQVQDHENVPPQETLTHDGYAPRPTSEGRRARRNSLQHDEKALHAFQAAGL